MHDFLSTSQHPIINERPQKAKAARRTRPLKMMRQDPVCSTVCLGRRRRPLSRGGGVQRRPLLDHGMYYVLHQPEVVAVEAVVAFIVASL